MLVTLTNTGSVTVRLRGEVAYRLSASREYGSATFAIPRGSIAWSPTYLSENGGSLVRIWDLSAGVWSGVIERLTFRPDGSAVDVEAREIAAIAEVRPTRPIADTGEPQRFRAISAGTVVMTAMRQCLAGVDASLLRPGACVECGPPITSYDLTGQSLADVLSDMMDETGQEWRVTDDGALDWAPATGAVITDVLTAGSHILGWERSTARHDWPFEVIARGSDGSEARATDTSPSRWPRQELLTVDSVDPAQVSLAARARLKRARAARLTYTGRVRRSTISGGTRGIGSTVGWGLFAWGTAPWGSRVVDPPASATMSAIRLGDWFGVLTAGADLVQYVVPVRLVGLTVSAESDWVGIECLGAAAPEDPTLAALDVGSSQPKPQGDTVDALFRRARRLLGRIA